MFGYVNINKPELKVKEFYEYKAYYCGLCNVLKKQSGRIGQMTLTYDMTFLIMLLSSLYEPVTIQEEHRCLAHPMSKHPMLMNEITNYGADMNLALTYHKLLDDWEDDRSVTGKTGMVLLQHRYKKIEANYERQCRKIKECLSKLRTYEAENNTDLDLVSGCFGDLMAELFVMKEDVFSKSLRRMGNYLGRFIYLMDAYEDLEKDKKSGSYNPLIPYSEKEDFEDYCNVILTMQMSECTKEFEKLPLIRDAEILRNILYAGVWKKYDRLRNKEKQEDRKEQNI